MRDLRVAGTAILFFVAGCTLLTGCTGLFASKEARYDKLSADLSHFSRALYWRSVDELGAFVEPEYRLTFLAEMKNEQRSHRITDVNVQNITVHPDKEHADVDLAVSYFRTPEYVVQERRERQLWQYHPIDGVWLLSSREILRDGEKNVPALGLR